jgi:hypothetical protein
MAALKAALRPSINGRIIQMAAGRYLVDSPLVVPDNVTLQGAGTRGMRLDSEGLPSRGLGPGPHTRLRARSSLVGDMITLGNGARLRRLIIEDVAGRASGNLVVVGSRKAQDIISATIEHCELINPKPSSADPAAGPIGRGLLVFTRNPVGTVPAAPHTGASITVAVRRCLFRAPANGSGIFAINFAPEGEVALHLVENLIGGGLDANGGVSRPVPVTDARLTIVSQKNLYRFDGTGIAGTGWLLHGGGSAPIPTFASPFTNGNQFRLVSQDDRVEGFAVGIHAAGGWRTFEVSGEVNDNALDIRMTNTLIRSTHVDLILMGAESGDATYSAGNNNHLVIEMKGVSGSGPRLNFYADAGTNGGAQITNPGTGNFLRFAQTLANFTALNSAIAPLPPQLHFQQT